MLQARRALLWLAMAMAACPAEDYVVRRYPVAVSVEGTPVRSTMALRLPVRLYGDSTLTSFAAGQRDAEEQAVARVMTAIRDNKPALAQPLLYTLPNPSPEQTKNRSGAVSLTPRTPAGVVAVYRESFQQFQNVLVEARVPVENGSLFIWRAESKKGPMRRGFLTQQVEGRVRVAEVSMLRPVEVFVLNVLGQLGANTLEMQTLDVAAGQSSYALALNSKGTLLEFAGDRMDVPLDAAQEPLSPAARVLRAAVLALRGRKAEQYLSLHTAESQQRLAKWFTSVPKEQVAAFQEALSQPRHVKFVVNADPVFLIFTSPVAGREWPVDSLRYDYVYRTPEGLRVANALRDGFLDDVLKNSPAVARLVRGELETPMVAQGTRE